MKYLYNTKHKLQSFVCKKSFLFFNTLRIMIAGYTTLVLLSSCEKPETPTVTLSIDTTLTEVSINLTSNYTYQKYFALSNYSEVRTNEKMDWDLGIRAHNNEYYIYLNSSRAMYAVSTELSFEEINSEAGYDFDWDNPNGHLDSLVIGNNHSTTYIIDMGYNPDLEHQGYKKIKFTGLTLTSADLDGSNQFEQTLAVNSDLFITPISLSQVVEANLFPNSNEWDILFSQYTHQFDDVTPYLVTGLLINPQNVEAVLDTTHSFSNIDYATATSSSFRSDFDAIGYDWKTYSIDEASYSIHYNKTFLIKTKTDEYYKLRFTDFYDDLGNKGEITFEIVRLAE